METEIIKIRPGDGPVSEEDEEKLRAAGAILQQGGLVAFPTETVYGLGGDALNPSSSQKIYAAKGRPSDNPLIVHIYKGGTGRGTEDRGCFLAGSPDHDPAEIRRGAL